MGFHIDPNDLKEDELDYELLAREYKIDDVSHRSKLATLIQCFKKEKSGKSSPPGIGSSPYTTESDIESCDKIISEINDIVQDENSTKDNIKSAFSRMSHVNLRLLRINAIEKEHRSELQRLESLWESLATLSIWPTRATKNTQVFPQSNVPPSDILDTASQLHSSIQNIEDSLSEDGAKSIAAQKEAINKSKKTHQQHVEFRRSTDRLEHWSASRPIDAFQCSDHSTTTTSVHTPVVTHRHNPLNTSASTYASTSSHPFVFPPTTSGFDNQSMIPRSQAVSTFDLPNMRYSAAHTNPTFRHSYHGTAHTHTGSFFPVPSDIPHESNQLFDSYIHRQHQINNNATQSNNSDINNLVTALITALNGRDNAQNRSNSDRRVPINQWKVTFSGDEPKVLKTDTNLFDFLNMVELYRKSDNMSEEELLHRIPHLLSGSAREWLSMNYHRIDTWHSFVTLIKKRFISADFDSVLLSEIMNYKQKKSESIGKFISTMQSKFRAMAEPPSPAIILRIIKSNLSFDNAMAASVLQINTIDELENIIKCRESVRNTQLAYKAHINNARPSVNEINSNQFDDSSSSVDTSEDDSEVNAIDNKRFTPNNKFRQKDTNIDKSVPKPGIICYNCRQEGHDFNHCKSRKTRIFCFRCGLDNTTTPLCPKCSPPKNVLEVSDTVEGTK